jgi:hypothetical protein
MSLNVFRLTWLLILKDLRIETNESDWLDCTRKSAHKILQALVGSDFSLQNPRFPHRLDPVYASSISLTQSLISDSNKFLWKKVPAKLSTVNISPRVVYPVGDKIRSESA